MWIVHHFMKLKWSIFSFLLGCTLTANFLGTSDYNLGTKNNFDVKQSLDAVKSSNSRKKTNFLVVLIISSPDDTKRRDVIRQTWLSECKDDGNVTHFFVIGSKVITVDQRTNLHKENDEHGDIVLLSNVTDSYHTLTSKVLNAFVWLDKTDDSYQYVLKCDDDSFVRVNNIIVDLWKWQDPNLYWGYFTGRAQVKRSGKWKETGWILCDNYLPYAHGGGYVLSRRLLRYISTNADYLQQYHSEDVSVGVWLANVANVTRLHDPRFDTEYMSRGCSNSYLVTHKQTESNMKQLHFNLQTTGKLCAQEHKVRLSYVYDWSVPPSRCCVRKDTSIP